ncbi:DUF5681 domain-containing protein [Roseobacter sp.]|uniref:DUF5681 domain-containing protein n=1 Tax=Roseobacter sp. TaxID=1907202 RepID=UPI0025FF19F6|nr:DUF5681 domain-containing protein [Roseobacter sp.]
MSDFDDREDEEGVGYKKPPASGRFPKGRSGNPKGRPKGSHRAPPKEEVMSQLVTIRDGDGVREVTAEVAFLHKLQELALKGNSSAVRAYEDLKGTLDATHGREDALPKRFAVHFIRPGSVNTALEILKMARTRDRYREGRATVVLEPWLVEVALKRLGDKRVTREEQETVWAATRSPGKVNWPDWWQVDGKSEDG